MYFASDMLHSSPLVHSISMRHTLQTFHHELSRVFSGVFVFVCLTVGIKPEKLYSASCVGREVNPLGVITHRQWYKSRAYQSGTDRVRVNLWSTLYKLMGWLASLDLAAPTQRLIPSHRTVSPHALYDVLILDGGRGKTMSDLVDSDRKLPVNLATLNKA